MSSSYVASYEVLAYFVTLCTRLSPPIPNDMTSTTRTRILSTYHINIYYVSIWLV